MIRSAARGPSFLLSCRLRRRRRDAPRRADRLLPARGVASGGGPVLALLAACRAPDPSEMFNAVSVEATDDLAVSQAFVGAIDGASETLHVAVPGGDDVAIAQALLAAADRGVEVEVVVDFDHEAGPGVAPLVAAGLPVQLADGPLTYFDFSIGADVTWDSADIRMTHAYVVADRQRVVGASTAGTDGPGTRLLFELRGEDPIEDLLSEHNQMFGGFDATAVTAFDAPAKSIVDARWRYVTGSEVELQLWFGPQERLVKRVIDATYAARTAVWVLTDELGAEGLAQALRRKADLGFDVKVVVGPSYGTTTNDGLAREIDQELAGVERWRVAEAVPTLVLVDYPAQDSGLPSRVRAMATTMPMYSAARLYRGEPVVTDQLADGMMWEFASTQLPERGGSLDALLAVFQDHLDRAEAF